MLVTRRKLGLTILSAGVLILFIGLLLLFNTTSVWALVTMGVSILVNTFGLAVLMGKDPD